jgi:hypothetical protein
MFTDILGTVVEINKKKVKRVEFIYRPSCIHPVTPYPEGEIHYKIKFNLEKIDDEKKQNDKFLLLFKDELNGLEVGKKFSFKCCGNFIFNWKEIIK